MKSRTKLPTYKPFTKDQLIHKIIPKKNTSHIAGETQRVFGKEINNLSHMLKENINLQNIELVAKKPTSISVYQKPRAKSVARRESIKVVQLSEKVAQKQAFFRLPEKVDEYYHQIIYYLMKTAQSTPRIDCLFMSSHKQISAKHRQDLINQLVEAHSKFRLLPSTLFKTISIMDRYLNQNHDLQKRKIQLLGLSCMFISAKYEEIYPPTMKQYIDASGKRLSNFEIIDMEGKILKKMEFNITDHTISQYIDTIGLQFCLSAKQIFLCLYVAELSLYSIKMVKYHPIEVALSCTILAKPSCEGDILSAFDKENDKLIVQCREQLSRILKNSCCVNNATKRKYSKQIYLEVGKLSSFDN